MTTPAAVDRSLELTWPTQSEIRGTGIVSRKNSWREKYRFPIEQQVHYQRWKGCRLIDVGVGKTTHISSQEVHFTTERPLEPGGTVRLAVDWPAMLDNTCLITLEICGSVVRCAPGTAVITVMRYEFRTRGGSPAGGEWSGIGRETSKRHHQLTVLRREVNRKGTL
jgi:hypothetical protein